jgi:hypothetical protein
MAVKLDLKFRAIAGLDSQDAEGQPVAHVIDELNGRPLVTGMPRSDFERDSRMCHPSMRTLQFVGPATRLSRLEARGFGGSRLVGRRLATGDSRLVLIRDQR